VHLHQQDLLPKSGVGPAQDRKVPSLKFGCCGFGISMLTLKAINMGWEGTFRTMQATERKQQREAQKRQKELERQAKEREKLSALEQARLEVETHENQLDVLLSVHKQQGQVWDWAAYACALPPAAPQKNSFHEIRGQQQISILPPNRKQYCDAMLKRGRMQDEQAFQEATQAYSSQAAEYEKMKSLARRILAGEHKAYIEVLAEFSPLAEITTLGSSLHFTVNDAKLIECALKVNGTQAIPSEVKTLSASGKLSVKAMPKGRFHEIYQDYVCGCMLRVAREVFALLPSDTFLITARADSLDASTGQTVEQSVLSAIMTRAEFARLDFDRLDPSDAVESFQHRGDFKATRKTEAFQPIVAFTAADVSFSSVAGMSLQDLVENVQRLREELKAQVVALNQRTTAGPAYKEVS
jgi:hypothetical protein